MATVTFASSSPSLSHTFFSVDDDPPSHPREASFSSYLTAAAADERFSLRLSGEFADQNITSVQISLGSGRKKKTAAQDGEIDVFGAERYFNGGMDGDELAVEPEKPLKASASTHKEAPQVVGLKSRSGTPSACSEVSANSRSSLLKHARTKQPRISEKPHQALCSRKFLGILFPCSCTDESSIQVDKNTKEHDDSGHPPCRHLGHKQFRPELLSNDEPGWRRTDRSASIGFGPKREECFSFPPALSPVVVVKTTAAGKVFQEENMARVASMDIFGTPFLSKEEVASSLRRSLTILNPFPGGGAREIDACSESSSELFEIESFSTVTLPLGGAGGTTSASTTCYEPSEASIEWSVVTASAANFSVASDGERSPPTGRKGDGRPHHQRSGGGLLLGCVSARAVDVASNSYKMPEKLGAGMRLQRHNSMDAAVPEIRYPPESPRSVDHGQGRGGLALAPRGIPRPIPPHLQHPH